jgi:tRNA (cmo5U34)-methyltransferase
MSQPEPAQWSEDNSQSYLAWADALVPRRAELFDAVTRLLASDQPGRMLELCCGAGILAERVLDACPQVTLTALDGSENMLRAAAERLARFGERVRLAPFRLEETGWRRGGPYRAIFSSLAVHHLDAAQKRCLFSDLLGLLAPGGRLVIADIVQPQEVAANRLAADHYDEIVKAQSLAQFGDGRAFERFTLYEWNPFTYPDPEVDKPSGLFEQLRWLAAAGFQSVDTYWLLAGHAVIGGVKD